MEAVTTSCSTHGECPWSMGSYSRELRNDAYPPRALGEVPPECLCGYGPETVMGEGWLVELVRGKCPLWCLALPLLGNKHRNRVPATLRLLLPSVWSLGRLYPLTRSPVMSTVVFYRLQLCLWRKSGHDHPSAKSTAQSTHQDNPAASMRGRDYKIGWYRGSPSPVFA